MVSKMSQISTEMDIGMPEGGGGERRTRVLLQPNLNAASCANSSPKPSIMPLMKGKNRLMATPRMIDQIVGGLYNTTAPPLLPGEEDGEADRPSFWLVEYCSLSVRMVTPDSVIGFGGSSEDMILEAREALWTVVGGGEREIGRRRQAISRERC